MLAGAAGRFLSNNRHSEAPGIATLVKTLSWQTTIDCIFVRSCRISAMNCPRPQHLAALVVTAFLFNCAACAAPLLRCDVMYAGSAYVVETGPVADPYPVASVDIGGRFRFKAVMVGDAAQVEYIKLYAYLDTARQPLLIQQASYLAPFTATATPYRLTGVQRLYAGPVERELIYSCTLKGVQP